MCRAVTLGFECEVFNAEIFTVRRAIKIVKGKIEPNPNIYQNIWIFSYSQAALKKLKKQEKSAGQEIMQKIRKTATEIKNINPNNIINIEWVPDHTNITGNEKADLYAKKGAELQQGSKKAVISLSFLKRETKNEGKLLSRMKIIMAKNKPVEVVQFGEAYEGEKKAQ